MGDVCHPYWPQGLWVPLPFFATPPPTHREAGNAKSSFLPHRQGQVRPWLGSANQMHLVGL